ncbi:MAG: hypothetical protein ACTSRP_23190, partial [Candidatus Helarchaeota archaeon]
VVCFTSQDAFDKRSEAEKKESLIEIDEYKIFDYNEYRYIDSEFFKSVEGIISEEMNNANIIIDLTPLSKLFSFKMLELANKYQIPCVYLGMDDKGNDKLYWMSNMKIKGEIKAFV